MSPFGSTRGRITREYALITPGDFVPAALPGWVRTRLVTLIAPAMGADFTQMHAVMEPGGVAPPAPSGVERVVFVLEGELTIGHQHLTTGGFAYLPPDFAEPLTATVACRINLFEKVYVPQVGVAVPAARFGNERDIAGQAFLGDPDARLQVLLPDSPEFDLAVNVFTYQPGATLPQVEIHVMEHGLLMLAGAGVYRLADDWHPVQAGDVIWMAPYCPQWFVAMGKTPAKYLYYKDVNRHPLAGIG